MGNTPQTIEKKDELDLALERLTDRAYFFNCALGAEQIIQQVKEATKHEQLAILLPIM